MDEFDEKEREFPWPQKGDRLFIGDDSDWWHNACLDYFPSGWGIYSSGYKLGADLLVQHVLNTREDQDLVIYPIVFLYRQFIELRLKELIKNGSALIDDSKGIPMHHNILNLWTDCRKILEEVWPDGNTEDLDSVEDCIKEFAKIDPKSMAFRYPIEKDGTSSLPKELRHINIRNLGQVMQRLGSLLDGCDTGISEMLSWKEESERY